jgi:hypothetical protein
MWFKGVKNCFLVADVAPITCSASCKRIVGLVFFVTKIHIPAYMSMTLLVEMGRGLTLNAQFSAVFYNYYQIKWVAANS